MKLWFEASEVAQHVLSTSKGPIDRLRAIVIHAESHAHTPDRWTDARREALEAEHTSESLDHASRRSIVARLARAYGAMGNWPEMDRLLCLQTALAGSDTTPLRELAARHNTETVEGCIAYVQHLNRVVAMGDVIGVRRQPSWLVELGCTEAIRLSRPMDGLANLRKALALDPSCVDTTLALAETLAALGAHDDAVSELRSSIGSIDPATMTSDKVVQLMTVMHRETSAIGGTAQANAAEAVSAFLGYGSPERLHALHSQSFPLSVPLPNSLDRNVLQHVVLPPNDHAVLWRIASTLDEIAPKLLRVDTTELGQPPAQRLSARANHPLRWMADRIARAFGPLSFDLCVDMPGLLVPRVLPGSPAILLLPSGFDNLSETEQAVGLARLLSSLALGIAWMDEINNEDLDGWIFGALAVGRPGWDGGALDPSKEGSASTWKPMIQKAISRKGRSRLDELAQEASPNVDLGAWRVAAHLATWRCAYVLAGDWTAATRYAWCSSPELAAVPSDGVASTLLSHPVLRELVFWGFSPETTPLLRAVGHAV